MLDVLLPHLKELLESFALFAVFAGVLTVLERRFPADDFVGAERSGSDLVYGLIENAGLSRLVLGFLVYAPLNRLASSVEACGVALPNVSRALDHAGVPTLIGALVQLLLFDLADYWRHRIEHRVGLLWAFHSVHHSQTRMTFLTFDRNHVVSLFVNSMWYAALARVLGIHFDGVVVLFVAQSFLEYLTHANLRLSWGRALDRVLVSPLYHRMHHAAAGPITSSPYGCNFASFFPLWDIVFNTAVFRYDEQHMRTGVADLTTDERGGDSWLGHQLAGFRLFAREARRLRRARRPLPADEQSGSFDGLSGSS